MERTTSPDTWVQAASAGDLAAFNHLVRTYQDGLYRWVLSMVKDEALADDITQSTLITAFEKLPAFRGGSFRSWLFTIARNRSIDEFRLSKRYPSISLDAPVGDEEDGTLSEFLTANVPYPEQALEQSEQAGIVMALLDALPEAFQQVLRLVDIEGLDYREAAEVLSLPIGTLKSRLTRGRLKLRGLLYKSGTLQ